MDPTLFPGDLFDKIPVRLKTLLVLLHSKDFGFDLLDLRIEKIPPLLHTLPLLPFGRDYCRQYGNKAHRKEHLER